VIGLRAPLLSCPYCRAAFAERDISFRCSGRTGPDGPHCHRLPHGFGQADHWPVTIVGSPHSGKTVLMTVLIHELTHRLGGAAGVAVRGLDEETLRAFHSDYDHPLYDQHTLPKPSDPLASCPPRSPLVFELAQTSPSRPDRRRRRRVIASFLDLSDLDLASPDGQDHAACGA
jgi:hypothetical protein